MSGAAAATCEDPRWHTLAWFAEVRRGGDGADGDVGEREEASGLGDVGRAPSGAGAWRGPVRPDVNRIWALRGAAEEVEAGAGGGDVARGGWLEPWWAAALACGKAPCGCKGAVRC